MKHSDHEYDTDEYSDQSASDLILDDFEGGPRHAADGTGKWSRPAGRHRLDPGRGSLPGPKRNRIKVSV